MPVFKVVAHDQGPKKLITASSLTELIDKAKQKLQLTEEKLKVVLNDDGTEIDDDESLVEIAASTQNVVTLMVLDHEKDWTRKQLEDNLACSTPRVDKGNCTTLESSETVEPFSLISLWEKFPIKLLEDCHSEKIPSPCDRRSMVSLIVDYMINEIKDVRRKTADVIAKSIVKKFPKSFIDNIGGKQIGSGHETLKLQIYNAIIYRKEMNKKRSANYREDLQSDEESDPAVECPVSRKHDQYGCVDYQPLLSGDESKRSQEEKRTMLCELHESREQDKQKLCNLMVATYPSQRLSLNAKNRDVSLLFKKWPYLRESYFIIVHATRLLDKPVQAIWHNRLETKGQAAIRYIRVTYKPQLKLKAVDKAPTLAQKNAMELCRLLDEAKKSVIAERYEVPKKGVIFALIPTYFKEDATFLYRIYSNDEADDGIRAQGWPYPVLVVKGQSLYDEQASFRILIDKSSFIETEGLFDGFLTLVVVYFVFGYAYPEQASKSFEFFQRYFLDINPDVGRKRDGKKRKSCTFDSKVLKLINAVDEFEKFMNDE